MANINFLSKITLAVVLVALAVLTSDVNAAKRCGYTKVIRKCRNGRELVRHYYKRRVFLKMRCIKRNQWRSCRSKGTTCRCSAVGDPHYRTYDNQLIHFMGRCRYTLSKLRNKSDKCYFNIEAQNDPRNSKRVSYTKFVDVTIAGVTLRLGKRRRLFIHKAGKWQNVIVPYRKGQLRVIYSGRLVQLVHTGCNVQVSFDGKSNAYVTVAKKYGGKMTGICGDCNGKKDDFRTKSGRDVRKSRNRYNLVGDSYRVPTSSKTYNKLCGKATSPPPKTYCKGHWRNLILKDQYCGIIIDASGPFGRCIRSGKVNTHQLLIDCRIDLCSNTHSRKRLARARCQILKAFAEQCAEAKITGINWRSRTRCRPHCGRNKKFVSKVKRCPATCASHFYGTKRLCHLIPKREGCECKKGFIRDGQLCVKPKNCKCLEACVDRFSNKKCRAWKKTGRCKKFPRFMNTYCKRTCGNCKPTSDCVDRASTPRCLRFRSQGKCNKTFYKELCGLTCNYKKCPCGKNKKIKGSCHPKFKFRSIFIIRYVRNLKTGKCKIKKSKKIVPCGKCPLISKTLKGRCNVCKGKRIITKIRQRRVKQFCRKSVTRKSVGCKKCENKMSRTKKCIKNVWVYSIYVQQRKGCFMCTRKSSIARARVDCKSKPRVIGKCSKKRNCTRKITSYRAIVKRCVCKHKKRVHYRKCCCPKSKSEITCKNGRKCLVTTKYVLSRNRCKVVRKSKCRYIKCPKTRLVKGKCYRNKNCFAEDIFHRVVRLSNCHCKIFKDARERKCCCPRPSTKKRCLKKRGITVVTVTLYRLNKKKNKCDRRRIGEQRPVRCAKRTKLIRGRCNRRGCIRVDKLLTHKRRACKCVWTSKKVRRTCCCSKNVKIKSKCVKNKYKRIVGLVKVLVRGRCVYRVKYTKKVQVKKCPGRRVVKRANCPKIAYKIVLTYKMKKCKCVPSKKAVKVNCRCPLSEGKLIKGPCRKNCWRSILYRKGLRNSRGKCVIKRRLTKQRCCCNKKPRRGVYCEKSSGNKVKKVTKWKFDKLKKTCVKSITKTVLPVVCKKSHSRRTKCNTPNKYFYIVYKTNYIKNNSVCKCRKVVTKQKVRCDCPKSKALKPRCKPRVGVLVYKTRHYRLVNGKRCQTFYTERLRKIKCSRKVRKYRTKCKKGRTFYYKIRITLKRRGCKCIRVKRRQRRYCNCNFKKPIKRKQCQGFVLIQFVTFYRRSSDHKKCLKFVNKRPIKVPCKTKPRVKYSKCKKCNRTKLTQYYGVNRKCKCGVVRTSKRKLKCCCPRPDVKNVCVKNTMFIVTIKYRLSRGKCYSSRSEVPVLIKCKRAKRKKGRCNKKTGKRVIHILYHVKVNCKCQKRRKIEQGATCYCPTKRRVRRKGCRSGSRKRTVIVERLVLKGKKCVWQVVKKTQEDCGCRKNRSSKRCIKNKLVRVTVTYSLEKTKRWGIYNIYTCVKERKIKNIPIKCRRSRFRTTRCINFKRRTIKYGYRVVKCKCKPYKFVIKCVGCRCTSKNYRRKICRNRKYSILAYRFVSGRCRCIRKVSTVRVIIPCKKTIRYKKRACKILRGYGIYRAVTKFVRATNTKCKCKTKKRRYFELCKCKRSFTRKSCIRKGQYWKYVKTRFVRRGKKCIRIPSTHTRQVRCKQPNRRFWRSKCNRKTCKRVIKLKGYRVKNCKCRLYVKRRTNRCCCAKRRLIKGCVKNKYRTFRVIIKILVTGRGKIFGKFPVRRCKTVDKTEKRRIKCKRSTRTEKCNKRTGVLRIRIVKYRVARCVCKRKVINLSRRCRCKKPVTTKSKCFRRRRVFKTKSWILINQKCVRRVTRKSCVCKCPKVWKTKKCNKKGVWITKVYKSYLPRSLCPKRCIGKVTKKSTPVACSAKSQRLVGKCNRKSCNRLVMTISYPLNRKKCKCQKQTKTKTIKCCCPKKSSSKKVCRRNRFLVWTVKQHKLRKGKCIVIRLPRKKRIYCGRPIRRVSKCRKNGYKTISVTVRFAKKCKCTSITERRERICNCGKIPKFKTTKNTKCSKNGRYYVTVTISYKLKSGQCVKVITITNKVIKCRPKTRTVRSCRKSSCALKIKHYRKTLVNCNCKYRLVKTVKAKCCCPRPRIVRKLCVKHNIRRTVFALYRLRRDRCRKILKREDRVLQCSKSQKKRRICAKAKNCNGRIEYKQRKAVNCKCVWRTVRKRPIKCCCSKAYRKTSCVNNEHIIKDVSYKLKNDRCLKTTKRTTRKTKCKRLGCKVRVSKCKNNFKRVSLVCWRAVKCKCQKYVKKTERVRCSCKKGKKTIDKKCNKKTCFKRTTIKVRRFNKRTRKCFWKVYRSWKTRCCCKKKGSKKHKCINDVIKRLIVTVVVFDRRRKVCRRIVETRNTNLMGCTRRAKLVNIRKGRCNKKTGYRRDRKKYVYAKNCKCRYRFKPSRKPCNCDIIQPARKFKKCKNNNKIVKVQKRSYLVNGKCVRRENKKVTTVTCSKDTRVKVHKCRKGAWWRKVVFRKQKVSNCKCKWVISKIRRKPCKCRKIKPNKRCIGKRIVTVFRFGYIKGYKCLYRKKRESFLPPCKVGKFVRQTKCVKGINRYYRIHIRRYRVGCKCKVDRSKRSCQCKCPKPSEKIICSNYQIITKRYKYSKKNCRCYRKITSNKRYPVCPPIRRVTKKRCIRRGNIGRRQIIYRSHLKNKKKCTCKVKKRVVSEVCWCKPRRKHVKKCRRNKKIVIFHYKYKLVKGRCGWYRHKKTDKEVKCARNRKLVSACNRKTRLITVTYIRHHVNKCKCVKTISRKKIICLCQKGKKYTKRGKCNKKTCMRKFRFYVWKLVKGKCIKKFTNTKRRCCCPKLKIRKYCDAKRGAIVIEKPYFLFSNGRCVKRVKKHYRKVTCKRKDRVRRKCNKKSGVLNITILRYRRFACKCKWTVHKKLIRRCWCKKKPNRKICQRSRRRFKIIVVTNKLVKGRCIVRKTTNYIPIRCRKPNPSKVVTCNKKTGIKKTTFYYRVLAKKCKCKLIKEARKGRCWCLPRKNVVRKCDKKKGIKHITTFVTVLKRSKCIRTSRSEKKHVVCSKKQWTTRKKCVRRGPIGVQVILRHRFVRSGCQCIKRSTPKRCNCKCQAPRSYKVCRGNISRTYIFHVVKYGCKCRIIKTNKDRTIKCPPKSKKVLRCNKKTRLQVVVHRSYKINSKCKCKPKDVRKRRTCLCRPSKKTTKCVANNTIIKRTWEVLINYKCYKRNKSKKIFTKCRPAKKRRVGRCNPRTGLQKYVKFIEKAVNCKCTKTKQFYYRICKCKKTHAETKKCNKKLCRQWRLIFGYRLIKGVKKNRCIKYLRSRKWLKCCCKGKPTHRKVCRKNKWINIHTKQHFVKSTRSCKSVRTEREQKVDCKTGKHLIRRKCNSAGILRFYFVERKIVKCKCNRRYYVKVLRCKCMLPKKVKACKFNRKRVITVTLEKLINHKCVKKVVHETRYIKCKPRRTKRLNCNRLTCKRPIVTVWYVAKNCKCKFRKRTRHQICCCNSKPTRWSKCSKKSGVFKKYTRTERFDRKRLRCIEVIKTQDRPTKCSHKKGYRKVGKCNIRRKSGVYQIVKNKTWYRVACHCTFTISRRKRLCKCNPSKRVKKCNAKTNILSTIETGYKLVKSKKGGRKCQKFNRVVFKKRIHCRKSFKVRGKCNKAKCVRNNLKVIVKRGNCKCSRRTVKIPTKCCCKRKAPRILCKRNRVVTVNYKAKFVCRNPFNCRCRYVPYSFTKPKKCKRPKVTRVTLCRKNSRTFTVRFTFYLLKNCKCRLRKVSKKLPCKKCIDYSSSCKKLEKQGFCETSPKVRKVLCKKTCGHCKCKGKVKYCKKFNYKLPTGKVYRGIFELKRFVIPKRKIKTHCIKACTKLRRCKTWQLRRVSRKMYLCILNNIKPKQLSRRTNGRFRPVRRRGSLYAVKFCKIRCPKIKVIKVSKCKCIKFLGNKKSCTRTATLLLYKYVSCRGCKRRIIRRKITCKPKCKDRISSKKCQVTRRAGGCSQKEVRKLCNHTCLTCDCTGLFRFRGPCNPKTLKRLMYVERRYMKDGLCFKKIRRRYKSCKVKCVVKTRRVPFPCLNGKRRVVYTVTRRLASNKCSTKVIVKTFPCAGCCPSIERKATACRKGIRTVTLIWWDRVKNCCRKKIEVKRNNCKGCRKNVVSRYGPCRYGFRLLYKMYEVRRKNKCSRHVIARSTVCRKGNAGKRRLAKKGKGAKKGKKPKRGGQKSRKSAGKKAKKSAGKKAKKAAKKSKKSAKKAKKSAGKKAKKAAKKTKKAAKKAKKAAKKAKKAKKAAKKTKKAKKAAKKSKKAKKAAKKAKKAKKAAKKAKKAKKAVKG